MSSSGTMLVPPTADPVATQGAAAGLYPGRLMRSIRCSPDSRVIDCPNAVVALTLAPACGSVGQTTRPVGRLAASNEGQYMLSFACTRSSSDAGHCFPSSVELSVCSLSAVVRAWLCLSAACPTDGIAVYSNELRFLWRTWVSCCSHLKPHHAVAGICKCRWHPQQLRVTCF